MSILRLTQNALWSITTPGAHGPDADITRAVAVIKAMQRG